MISGFARRRWTACAKCVMKESFAGFVHRVLCRRLQIRISDFVHQRRNLDAPFRGRTLKQQRQQSPFRSILCQPDLALTENRSFKNRCISH